MDALVVEDDDAIGEAIAESLEDEGYRVARARNGIEALHLLDWGFRPAVMLVDLMMPHMNGGDFLEHVRADRRLASIPAIVVTASTERLAGMAVLRKPVELRKLLDAVAALVPEP